MPNSFILLVFTKMMALKWVHDILRTVGGSWMHFPAIHFCFDSGSAAGVVFGPVTDGAGGSWNQDHTPLH